jgi:hypothetical protein
MWLCLVFVKAFLTVREEMYRATDQCKMSSGEAISFGRFRLSNFVEADVDSKDCRFCAFFESKIASFYISRYLMLQLEIPS